MLIPVRCLTCNKVIGNLWEPYTKMLKEGFSENDSMNKLNLTRYCCKRMLLTHVDLIPKLIKYS